MKRFAAAAALVFALQGAQGGELLPLDAAQQQLLGITTAPVGSAGSGAGALWQARVEFAPDAEWVVSALQAGTLKQWLVLPGQSVRGGELLALVHSEAALDLQREYLAALAQLAVDDAARQRDQGLFDNGVIAARRNQETRQRWQQQSLAVAALRKRLELVGFSAAELRALEQRRELRADYPLRAPADAVVVERMGQPGQPVAAMAPLLRLGDPRRLWLSIQVPAADARGLRSGAAVQIEGGGSATLRQAGGAIDAATQSVTALAELPADTPYRAGELLQVRTATAAGGLRIPAAAVVRQGERTLVFVAVQGGFEARPVQAASAGGGDVLVSDGLKAGERIAVTGIAALKGQLLGLGGGE